MSSYQVGDVVESRKSGFQYELLQQVFNHGNNDEWQVKCVAVTAKINGIIKVGSLLTLFESSFRLVQSVTSMSASVTVLPPVIAEQQHLEEVKSDVLKARQALRRFLAGEV